MILKSSEKTDVNMTELVATVDAETFEKAIEAVYQQQKKNISLPGFRKGKVPRRLCERTYGEGVFFEDALNLILNMEMPGVIAEAALNLVDAPKVEVTAVSKEDGLTVGAPYVAGATVSAKVLKNGKAKKITVMTYKPKKSEKKKQGHRQPYTKVQIEAIEA